MDYLRRFQANWIEKYPQAFLRVATVGSMLLHVVRQPTWTYTHPNWKDIGYYPAWGLSKLPAKTSYVIALLLLLLNQWCVYTLLYTPSVASTLKKSRIKVLTKLAYPLTVIKLVDAVAQIIVFNITERAYWSLTPLEAIIFIVTEPCFESKLYKTMYRSLRYFGGLMFLFVCVLISWTVLQMTTVQSLVTVNNLATLDDNIWEMLMILNTADWPTPTIKYYNKGTITFVFYIAYSVICDWGFLNLVLGLIVAFFEESFTSPSSAELQQEKKKEIANEEAKKMKDSNVVGAGDDNGSSKEDDYVDPVAAALETMQVENAISNPIANSANDSSPTKDSEEKSSIGSVSGLEIEAPGANDSSRPTWITRNLTPYVENKKFNLFTDLVLFVLGFNFILGKNSSTILNIQMVLNSLELLIRILVRKTSIYEWTCNFRNLTNTCFIISLVTASSFYFFLCRKSSDMYSIHKYGSCREGALNGVLSSRFDHGVVFCIMLIRGLIFLRIALVSRNFTWDYIPRSYQKKLIRVKLIVLETSEALSHLAIMLALTMYIFASIGEHLWGGKLSKNPDLPGYTPLVNSIYAQSGYWPLNFNDPPSSLTTMFTLLYINNMQITTAGCVAVSNRNAYFFFGAFYIVGVLYVRNIFTSFLWSRIGKILDNDELPLEDIHLDDGLSDDEGDGDNRLTEGSRSSCDNRDSHMLRESSIAMPRLSNLMALAEVRGSSKNGAFGSRWTLGPGKVVGNDHGRGKNDGSPRDSHVGRQSEMRPSNVRESNFRESTTVRESTFMVDNMLKTEQHDLDTVVDLQKDRGIHIEEDLSVIVVNARYGEINEPFMERISLKAFKIRSRMFRGVLVACWMLTLVRLFQSPPWLLDSNGDDRDNFMFSDVPFMSPGLTAAIKVPLLFVLLSMLTLEVISQKDFGRSNRAKFILFLRYIMISICLTSVITLLIGLTGNATARRVDWYLSFFSVTYTFWFDRNAWKRVIIVMGVLPKLLMLMFTFGVFIAVASVFCDWVFDPNHFDHGDDDYNADYYSTYIKSVWTTFAALTSSSFPQQFMPGTRAYREFAVYMATVISLGGFVILEGSIAVVNTAYQYGVVASNRHVALTKKNSLLHVFRFINSEVENAQKNGAKSMNSPNRDRSGSNAINHSNRPSHTFSNAPSQDQHRSRGSNKEKLRQVIAINTVIDNMFKELYSNYREFSKYGAPTPEERCILRTMLDCDGNGEICKYDFQYFYHVTRLTVKRVPINYLTKKEKLLFKSEKQQLRATLTRSTTGLEKFGARVKLFRLACSKGVQDAFREKSIFKNVEQKHWYMMADSIAGLMGIIGVLSKEDTPVHIAMCYSIFGFHILEFFFKWFILGINTYARDMRNKIDFSIGILVMALLIIGETTDTVFGSTKRTATGVAMDIAIMLRLFFYPRNVACFASPVNGVAWKSVMGTVARLTFAFAEAFICLGFTWAQLGVLLYGGVIPKKGIDPVLDASPFGLNDFYILNFNDMTSSFITLFCCLRISDWDVVTQGVVTVTKSTKERFFFGMWYLLGVLLMLNVLKSYFVIVFRSRPKQVAEDDDDAGMATHMAGNDDGEGYIDAETLSRYMAPNTNASGSAKEEDLEAEIERLEKINVSGDFVIDLSDLITRPDFVAVEADKHTFINEIEKMRTARKRKETLAKHKHASISGMDDDMLGTFTSTKQAELAESTAEKAMERNKYRYIVKFPFKQGMDASERLPIMRRMAELSMK